MQKKRIAPGQGNPHRFQRAPHRPQTGGRGRSLPDRALALLLIVLVAPALLVPLSAGRAQEAPPESIFDPTPEAVEETAASSPGSPEGFEDAVFGAAAEAVSAWQEEASGPSRVIPSSRGGARPSMALSAPPAPTPEPEKTAGERIVEISQKYLGYRYLWGGASPSAGFDCSGFMSYVYKEAGFQIPAHDLRGQLNAGPRIDRDHLQPGDLLFFENTYIWGLSHGGIYLGGDRFIHAVEPGVGVAINSLKEGFWSRRLVGGSRPWAR